MPSPNELKKNSPKLRSGGIYNYTLPKAINHTRFMQPMKDQKGKIRKKPYECFFLRFFLDCGACYAFAALAALEYEAKLKKKNQVASEQNVIDCDVLSFGCEGMNDEWFTFFKLNVILFFNFYRWLARQSF